MIFDNYQTDGFFDELFDENGQPRPFAMSLINRINSMPQEDVFRRQKEAEAAFMNLGITFTVYGESEGAEKIFPFDIIPRLVDGNEWDTVERGLKQRIYALNLFIDDVYNDQKILKDGVIPADLVLSAESYRKQCVGLKPPKGIWCHITGTDLIRDKDGTFYVLEDNLRCPSGVSYVLENRHILKRTFPYVFQTSQIRAVDDYPNRLRDLLEYLAPDSVSSPTSAVLTPGVYNSAYFEHSFLARQMGIELVEGRDLVVRNGFVYMRTTKGFQRLDVLYRRLNDDFLDPNAFNPESLLGVPDIFDAYRQGKIALVNAPGTGIADDKVIYSYVPEIIKYYMNEEPIVPNVPTYVCSNESDMKYVLENLETLVVKAANESGGYGMLVGVKSTEAERNEFAKRIKANPRNYIAQPTIALSRAPVIVDDHFEGRHIDLRPYILYGEDIYVLPGGLTRVALNRGSLVVNSSQGGGSKDTWVVASQSQKQAPVTMSQSQTSSQSK
ncbi:MAG: circularly permuted type 2 ATP-grasp protein [Candidatus Hinthialibacter antarcticus]|nr:circularly permuted type 2 ATP-grasp protein [Candidatus Hinthialibacter antarcticus]